MSYDPRALGADCDNCPLNSCKPVPTEHPQSGVKGIAIVGEAPGEQEEERGRPFVGPSGNELARGLRKAAIDRRECLVSNVLLCRPPKNKLDAFMRKAKREATAEGKEFHSPIKCCLPRLQNEIKGYTKFVTLGKVATNAIAGTKGGILPVRGAFMDLEGTMNTPARRVMPTIHPAFVLRAQRWRHVFLNDLYKASRWFQGRSAWVEPEIVYDPSPEELREFLWSAGVKAYDIETDSIECLTARIRCIAVGTADKVVVVSFMSKEDGRKGEKLMPRELERRYIQVFKEYFEDETQLKVAHNGITYDNPVLKHQWGIIVKGTVDTLLIHKGVESELSHSLAYVASIYTEAPAWKTDRDGNKLSTDSESDRDLAKYCGLDVAVTARVLPPMFEQLKLRDQDSVWRNDQKMQVICASMHEVGMYVDQAKRQQEEKKLLQMRYKVLNDLRAHPDVKDDFNPGSVYQLRDLFFGRWELCPDLKDKDRLTDTDDPSTADIVLRALLTDRTVAPEHRAFIKLVRRFRKLQKVLGTYVIKLRPQDVSADGSLDDIGWDEDDDWVDRETRKRYGLIKRGIVVPGTGRMHPGYSIGMPVTGRLSSSKPINAQNFPKGLRAIVTAGPGHRLVGADADQLELRIAAALWQVELYLRAFAEGKDPHSMTAFAVFGDAFLAATGLSAADFERPGALVSPCYVNGTFDPLANTDATKMRNLSKAVQYASQYMGSVETVHTLVTKTEVPAKDASGKALDDGTTDLPFALMPLKRIREMRQNWLDGAPQFEKGWEKMIEEYRRQGYLREPVHGRRRDFLDGEDPNQIVNFKVQSGAAGLMNTALIEIYERVEERKRKKNWGPHTGVINQCHDSIVIECPETEEEVAWSKWVLEDCMNQTHENLPGVKFTSSSEDGHDWKKVG